MKDDCEPGALIVKGASCGIGASIAALAGRRGFRVVVNFRTGVKQARGVVEEILNDGGKALAIKGDVSQEEDVVRMFEIAEREFSPIKGLVNNAGITGGFARVEDAALETLNRVFAVNVVG